MYSLIVHSYPLNNFDHVQMKMILWSIFGVIRVIINISEV